MDNWQDIESAPRDGTWIIAWDGQEVLPLTWVNAYWEGEYTGWAFGDTLWGGTLYDGVNEAKHQPLKWQPLPTPPEAV